MTFLCAGLVACVCVAGGAHVAFSQQSPAKTAPGAPVQTAGSPPVPGKTPGSAGKTPGPKPSGAAGGAPGSPVAQLNVDTVDVAARSHDILAHLNAMIRYYREFGTPMQKVGEPSDVLYSERSLLLASQATGYAFQAAKAVAVLLEAYQKQVGTPVAVGAVPGPAGSEQQRLQQQIVSMDERVVEMRAAAAALDDQIAHAPAKQVSVLRDQRQQIEGAIQLTTTMQDAMQKIVSMSDAQGGSGLAGSIQALQHSVPEIGESKAKPATTATATTSTTATALTNLNDAGSEGVVTEAELLFQLGSTQHDLDLRLQEVARLRTEALDLRTPVTKILRGYVEHGQQLAEQAMAPRQAAAAPMPATPASSGPATPANAKARAAAAKAQAQQARVQQAQQAQEAKTVAAKVAKAASAPGPESDAESSTAGSANASGSPGTTGAPGSGSGSGGTANPNFDTVTSSLKGLAAAAVPLSQEIIVLEQSQAELTAWRTSVHTEYSTILRKLLLRIASILIALGLIFGAGELWRKAAERYVHDTRRRRQFLVLRRTVVGLLSAVVVVLGFVSQFNSLATFAGFITAGIAVGLQTILLSVAAYFFIVGRYGVRVGDRISVAGVTGDVIDVGLVRFYLMELAGSGTELQATGRVAVFSNAVLFQAGTPLYKQIPGTEYAWHELLVKLNPAADYQAASKTILKTVTTLYDGYRPSIERQHMDVTRWMQSSIESPCIESRVQFADGALQLWVRFPVEMKDALKVDESLTQSLVQMMTGDPVVKDAVAAMPVIKASVKG